MDEGRGLIRRRWVGLTIALVAATGARALAADQIEDALIGAGKVHYEKYCMPCHGPGGAPGSAVSTATKQPVDLRTYVRRHGGKFPTTEWLDVIVDVRPDGTHAQVWQRIVQDQLGISQDAVARGVVGSIARYVNSVQTK